MLDTLRSIVGRAAELVKDIKFDIEQKEGYANIVTSSDIAVQEFLKKELSEMLPGSGFLCEEDDKHDLGREYTWIIDPIDGTANYARGNRECAICVGLKHNDAMEIAVVYVINTGDVFYAERGKGAFLNGKKINVSTRPFADAVLCTALPVYHKEYAKVCSEIILDAFMQCNDIRRYGAAAPELCYLALGRCEMYFEYLLSPWDFAAASLILEEAGGCLCDISGRPLDPTKSTGVLAANSRENLDHLTRIVSSHVNF